MPWPTAIGPSFWIAEDGNTQLQSGNSNATVQLGEQAIKLAPARWEAYALVGGALMNLKRYEEATDKLSKAIDRAPTNKQDALRDLRKQCVLAEAGTSPSTSANVPATPVQTSTATTQAEVVLWKSIENSNNQSDLEEYLKQYPNGAFAGLAESHLDKLRSDESALREQQAAEARAQQDRQAQRASAAQAAWQAGVQIVGTSRVGTMNWSGKRDQPSSIFVNPNGISVTVNGKTLGPLFSVACPDMRWKWNAYEVIYITVISTRKVYAVYALPDTQQISRALDQYCPGREDR